MAYEGGRYRGDRNPRPRGTTVHRGKGRAKQMVRFAVDYARKNRHKVIRIDVLKGNRNAKKLYSGMSFRYLHTLPMFYEDTGWTDFELYEYPLLPYN